VAFLDRLPHRYRVILCDLWGVVHDGYRLYPGAADRLLGWRAEGRRIVLITNAPRTAAAVEEQLVRIGLPRAAWDGIAAGGQAGIDALKRCGAPVGFLGTDDDRRILVDSGVSVAPGDDFSELACTGLPDRHACPTDYAAVLKALAKRDVRMHCLNPDRVVIHGGRVEHCAGALADLYTGFGGRVEYYGKPYPAIYRHALSLVGDPSASEVLAIGDGLQTDMLGAAQMGFDAIFVTGGIHAGQAFPDDFGSVNGIPEWEPVALVEGLDVTE
jgi:HAD superfamily hydrolase (TIGR01459 family)